MSSLLRGLKFFELGVGDCVEFMKHMPDGSVHSVVTSPPYYLHRSYTDDPNELGHESSPGKFVDHLVSIFREARRILRDDGTMFLNMGDTYIHGNRTVKLDMKNCPPPGNMCAIPWRLGLALQADGWILRQDVIWSKAGGMPEPVRDRFVRAHEYVLLLTKTQDYFFDYVAIQVDDANRRDVLHLSPSPYRPNDESKQHFAVMNVQLAEVCVLAGTPPKACSVCGAPWKRLIQGKSETKAERLARVKNPSAKVSPRHDGGRLQQGVHIGKFPKVTLGFEPTCQCKADSIPGVVFDPFSGLATTGVAALRNKRRYLGVDIDATNEPVARTRLDGELLSSVSADTQTR